MKVSNPWGVPNQFIIIDDSKNTYFQSYSSIIVKIGLGYDGKRQVILDQHFWNYSRTTGKYRNMFLGETTAETKAKIAAGTYILADLNS